jgi:hypothetical protein
VLDENMNKRKPRGAARWVPGGQGGGWCMVGREFGGDREDLGGEELGGEELGGEDLGGKKSWRTQVGAGQGLASPRGSAMHLAHVNVNIPMR